MFNKYFSEIGQKMAAKIARSPSSYDLPVNLLTCSQSKSFFFKPITANDVLTHINNINPMKTTGLEGIPLKFIKLTTVIITPVNRRFEENKHNSRKISKTINLLLHNKTKIADFSFEIKTKRIIVDYPTKLANRLNKHF